MPRNPNQSINNNSRRHHEGLTHCAWWAVLPSFFLITYKMKEEQSIDDLHQRGSLTFDRNAKKRYWGLHAISFQRESLEIITVCHFQVSENDLFRKLSRHHQHHRLSFFHYSSLCFAFSFSLLFARPFHLLVRTGPASEAVQPNAVRCFRLRTFLFSCHRLISYVRTRQARQWEPVYEAFLVGCFHVNAAALHLLSKSDGSYRPSVAFSYRRQ